jgi:hypothetical protein
VVREVNARESVRAEVLVADGYIIDSQSQTRLQRIWQRGRTLAVVMLEVGGITRVVLRLVVLVGLLVAAEHLVEEAELGLGHSQHGEKGYQVAHFARHATGLLVVLRGSLGATWTMTLGG